MDNRIPPPILIALIAALMWPVAAHTPAPVWRGALALALFLLAGGFGLPAIRAFVRARTTINPVQIARASTLVTGGVYRLSRNPMYLALTLLLAAWALWLGGIAVWAGPLGLALWLDRFQIRPEERAMAARFGEDYARYRAEVRRWL